MEVARLAVAFEATGQQTVARAIDGTQAKMKGMADSSVASANRIGSAFSGAGKLIALGLGAAAAVGIGSVIKGFIGLNANAEQYRASLETVTGSQAKANALFSDLQKFAAATPFEFPELVQASINLESFGLKTTDWIDTVGNTASAMGKSVDQVTQAVLDTATGSYARLKELGISAQVEGDKLNIMYMKNGEQIVETVDKNNKAVILSTVQSIWNEKYAGAMRKQSKTFNGMLSTFKDNVNITMAAATRPIFNFAKDGLDAANRFFDRFNAKMQSGLNPVMAGLSALHVTMDQVFGKTVGDTIDGVLRGIVNGIQAVANAVGVLKSIFAAMGGALLTDLKNGDISGFFTDLKDDLMFLVSKGIDLGTIAVKGVLSLGSDILDGAANIWGWFKKKLGVGPIGDGTDPGAAITFGDVFVDAAIKLGETLQAVADDVGAWIKTQLNWTGDKIVTVGKLVIEGDAEFKDTSGEDPGMSFMRQVANGIRKAPGLIEAALRFSLARLPQAMGEIAGRVGSQFVANIANNIAANPMLVAKAIGIMFLAAVAVPAVIIGAPLIIGFNFMRGLIRGLNQQYPILATWIKALPERLATAMGDVGAALTQKGKDLIGGCQDGVVERWKTLKAWFGHLGDYSSNATGDVTSSLKQKGTDLIKGAHDGVIERWLILKAWAGHFGDYVLGAIPDLTATLFQKGYDLIQGVMDGWTTASNILAVWAANFPSWVASQIPDPSNALYDVGFNLVWGMAQGIYGGASMVADAVNSIAASIPAGIRKLLGIGSPSRVMADLFRWVPVGAAAGIEGNISHVQRAANRMAAAAAPYAPTFSPSYSPSYAGAASRFRSTPSGGGGQIIHVTFGAGSYVGPGAMREIKRMAADGAVGIVDQRQAARSVGAMRR